jgi:hypothetical protein
VITVRDRKSWTGHVQGLVTSGRVAFTDLRHDQLSYNRVRFTWWTLRFDVTPPIADIPQLE